MNVQSKKYFLVLPVHVNTYLPCTINSHGRYISYSFYGLGCVSAGLFRFVQHWLEVRQDIVCHHPVPGGVRVQVVGA